MMLCWFYLSEDKRSQIVLLNVDTSTFIFFSYCSILLYYKIQHLTKCLITSSNYMKTALMLCHMCFSFDVI